MIVMVVAVGGGGGDGGARSLDTCLRKVKRNLLGRNSPIIGDKYEKNSSPRYTQLL